MQSPRDGARYDPKMAPQPSSRPTLDRCGAFASGLCVTHCLVCGLAPGLIAGLGLGVVISEDFELGLSVLAVLITSAALVFGWRKHGSLAAAGLLGLGITGIVAARAAGMSGFEEMGETVGILGGLALVVGHFVGMRAQKRCCEACPANAGRA